MRLWAFRPANQRAGVNPTSRDAGYYRKPEGYVSPQEQAELDAAEEAKRIVAAREARQKAELDAWVSELSLEERATIISASGGNYPMPADTALRLHFKAQVWPKIMAKER